MSTRRPLDAVESLRNSRRAMGDGTVQGRSRIATPVRPDTGRFRSGAVVQVTTPDESSGEVCSLKATDVAVSTTPTVVEFTTAVGEQAWVADLAFPSGDIVPSFADAYYDIQVELDRGTFTGTVKVEILRGDTVVWGPDMSPYWNDPQMPVTAKGRLTAVDPSTVL